MDRNEFVGKVKAFAAALAEEHGCDRLTEGEDRQKGVWGEEATAYLERKVGGDCASTLRYEGGEYDEETRYHKPAPECRVTFRFRFSDPCVTVWLDHGRTMAELEFTDWKDGESTGDFRLHEVHGWGDGAVGLLVRMSEKWADFYEGDE